MTYTAGENEKIRRRLSICWPNSSLLEDSRLNDFAANSLLGKLTISSLGVCRCRHALVNKQELSKHPRVVAAWSAWKSRSYSVDNEPGGSLSRKSIAIRAYSSRHLDMCFHSDSYLIFSLLQTLSAKSSSIAPGRPADITCSAPQPKPFA